MAQQTFEELVAAVKQAESRDKRYKDDGKTLTTSAKGALGEMQVMPKTIKDPGFGVTPAKDKSPDEIARVGVDYLQAMKQKYGDTEKALIAYNWGPGSTDKWLASGADPKKLPAETKTYVERVKGFLGGNVSRETTVAKKEREPLPPSLPPMAQADIKTPAIKPEAAARVASLGPGYQAALALSFLAETDDEEDRKTTITQEYLAKAQEEEDDRAATAAIAKRQSNVFADLSNTTIRSPFAQPQQPVMMKDGGDVGDVGDVGDRLTPQQIEQYVGQKTKAQLLLEKFKEQAHPRNFTSIIGLGPNIAYETYKYATGKDPLRDLQKELQKKIDYEVDTGSEPIGTDSGPISGSLPPIRRAEGSPKEGERKLDRETMDMLRRQGTSPASLTRVAPPADISSSAAGLPGLMLLADPRIDQTNAYGYMLDGGDDTKNRAMAQAMFLNKSRSEDYPDTIAHETEHLLARQNLGSAANINSKFDELIGNKGTSRLNFVRDAVKAAPYLKEKYDLQSSYLDPKMFEYQSKFGLGKNLLYEQLASLAALEQRHKIDLTKDPELRKTLFSRPDVRETYNAITGLRQTRLDPRDLSPYTRVAEPGMLDAIKGVFKRAEGGPVYRANGSPEEGERLTPQQIERLAAQESAEREAASTPAFIAQKSGIGRKAGPVSQALQSGQGQIEFLKGMTNIPQNILGAPMDISNMIANVYGGGVEKPFMGSEYIKEGLRAQGLGFTPSTDPTLAAFYGAGDLGSNLVNPAGATRTAVKVAGKTGEAAKMLGNMAGQEFNAALMGERPGTLLDMFTAPAQPKYAVRNKGTPVAMAGRFNNAATGDEAEQVVKSVTNDATGRELSDKPLSNWFSKTVTRYLRSDFATPDDQLVKAAEKGQLLHLAPKDFTDRADDQILKKFLERRQADLPYVREAEGFPKSNIATQPYGKLVEDITDVSAYPERVGDLTPNRVPPSMRNLVDTRPETRVTDYAPGIVQNLKLNELRDKMLSVRESDGKYGAYGQPAVKIPEDYLLSDDTLVKLNVAAASNRMAKYTNWQDNTRQRMATTALREDPRFTRATLQEGKYLGVALPDIRKDPEVRQLVLDVGCDGGWCTRYSQNAKAYGGGFSRLHIMVTGEGKQARPVAQFAVADSGPAIEDGRRFSITEVKEKGNTADFANNPALPAIQEYIQFLDKTYRGLDYVDDLKGLRMTQLPEYPNQVFNFFDPTSTQKMDLADKFGNVENGMRAVRDKAVDLNNGSRFVVGNDTDMGKMLEQATNLLVPTKKPMTMEEIKANIIKRMNLFGPPKEKATGGMIERQPDDNRRYM